MVKGEHQKLFEQEEAEDLEEEEEVEVEETTLLVRKSRTENESKITEIDFAVSNEVSEITSNGHIGHSELVQNEEKTPAEELEIEKVNGVLEKEPEAIDEEKLPAEEEQEIEKNNGVLEKEPEAINGEQIRAQEQEIEEPSGVLEKEPEAINGEQKSQNLVFHDNVEGIWKCRLCSWTYRNGSVCVEHFQIRKGQLHHKLMNLKTLDFQSKGVGSTFTYLKEKQIPKEPEAKEFDVSSLHIVVQSNSTSANGYNGEIKNSSISNSTSKPTQVSEIESEAVELINEDDFDVERVIEKQTTHDLFCPNCNSCITKRVILRKRKRRIRVSDEEFQQNPKTAKGPELAQPGGDGVDNDAQITVDEPDRGPAVFRCLSCFTFFIPSEDGFKCLPIKDWFASMFAPNKLGPVVEQGSSISQTVVQQGEPSSNLSDQPSVSQKPLSPGGRVETIGNNYTWEGGDETSPLQPSVNGNVANGLDLNPTVTIETQDQLKDPNPSQVVHNNHGSDLSVTAFPARTQVPNWKPVKDAIVFSQGLQKFPISANNGSSTLEESDDIQIQHPGAKDKEVINHHSPTSDADGKFNISVSIPHDDHGVTASITTDTFHEHNSANFISNDNGQIQHSKGSEHIITTTNIIFSNESPNVDNTSVFAPDTEITMPPNVAGLVNQTSVSDSARKEYEIEVVKSIVYGGLAESITSLSVVSSAVGGGAATLNVLALGAANLIGGLFIICHNLWDLRYHQVEHVSNQINEDEHGPQDRYRELLGRRQSFVLHAVIAIISYIAFGLVPPLVYGFSFHKSDDRQLKLVVVGATSLVCILILAIAKAYTHRRPKPYLKTVATYVVLGFMVSGVSYVAGELVERLLDELGLFQIKPTGSGWASY